MNLTPVTLARLCNKNGVFYALKSEDLAAGPVWTLQVGVSDAGGLDQCNAGAVWDSAHERLFVAGNTTTIGGLSYPGSVRQLDPSSGAVVWARGLKVGPVIGTPTLDGGGALAVASYDKNSSTSNAACLLNAATGRVLTKLVTGSPVFARAGVRGHETVRSFENRRNDGMRRRMTASSANAPENPDPQIPPTSSILD